MGDDNQTEKESNEDDSDMAIPVVRGGVQQDEIGGFEMITKISIPVVRGGVQHKGVPST